MMSKKGVSSSTVNRIRTLSKEGHTTNYIQKQLQKEHLGIRRTILLGYIREFKGRKPKAEPYKYTPKKYRRKPAISKPKPETEFARKMRQKISEQEKPKHVAVYGKVKGISKRIEVSGKGTNIYRFLIDGITHPPKQRITRINADKEKGLSARAKYIDYKEEWDYRPTIKS